jgi:hypothetical protein
MGGGSRVSMRIFAARECAASYFARCESISADHDDRERCAGTLRGREVVTFSYGHRDSGGAWYRPNKCRGAAMNFAKPLGSTSNGSTKIGSTKIDKIEGQAAENIQDLHDQAALHQAASGSGEMTATELSTLLGRVSGATTREIDDLIGDLQLLRRKLQADGNRIQRDITEYASLSQSVMQLTKIVSDSVKKLPDPPSVGG